MLRFAFTLGVVSSCFFLSACQEATQLQDAAQHVAQAADQLNGSVQSINSRVQDGAELLQDNQLLPLATEMIQLQQHASADLLELQTSYQALQNALRDQDAVAWTEHQQQLQHQLQHFTQRLNNLSFETAQVEQLRQRMLDTVRQIVSSSQALHAESAVVLDVEHLPSQLQQLESDLLRLSTMLAMAEQFIP